MQPCCSAEASLQNWLERRPVMPPQLQQLAAATWSAWSHGARVGYIMASAPLYDDALLFIAHGAAANCAAADGFIPLGMAALIEQLPWHCRASAFKRPEQLLT